LGQLEPVEAVVQGFDGKARIVSRAILDDLREHRRKYSETDRIRRRFSRAIFGDGKSVGPEQVRMYWEAKSPILTPEETDSPTPRLA
jgi:hypothetical protein